MTDGLIKSHQEGIRRLLNEQMLPILDRPHDLLEAFLESYILQTNEFLGKISSSTNNKDRIKIFSEHISFRKNILELINSWIPNRKSVNIDAQLDQFESHFAEFINLSPNYHLVNQDPERFNSLPGDSGLVGFIKVLKRTGFLLYALPVKFYNVFRKLAGKDKKQPHPWKQRVPVKKLLRSYYHNYFLELAIPIVDDSWKQSTIIAKKIWDVDDSLIRELERISVEDNLSDINLKAWQQVNVQKLDAFRSEIVSQKEKHRKAFSEVIGSLDQSFEKQVSLAGTLEFSVLKHADRKIRWKARKLKKRFLKQIGNRINTNFALADDWKFNQEIYIVKDNAHKAYLLFKHKLHSREDAFNQAIPRIKLFIEKIDSEVMETTLEPLYKNLHQQKISAEKILQKQIIPELSDLLIEQNILLIIDEMEQNLVTELGVMQEKRVLIPDFDPSRAYDERALQETSPFELLNFEMLSKLRLLNSKSKTSTMQKLENLHLSLDELGRMLVYNLDSSIAMLDQQGDAAVHDCFLESKASLERAIKKTQDLEFDYKEFVHTLEKDFHIAVDDFCDSVGELTDNSKVEQIRFRIAKARALKKGVQVREYITGKFQLHSDKSKLYYRFIRKGVQGQVVSLRGHLGIHDVKKEITIDVSDFLIHEETEIKKLPFVYRRLFINEPLKESVFYFKRNVETERLDNAFARWQQGSFVPVLVIGEKGSGISTFIQMYVKARMQRKPAVFSVLPSKRIGSEEDLLALLGQSFRGKVFDSLKDFYEFADKHDPFVAFVDKLQMMYLRQPGGFNTMKKFFELISTTSKKIFWICTCSLYASKFLNKSVGLYNYFPTLIPMRDLNVAEIRKLILLRHNASGYNLEFTASQYDLADRNYIKRTIQGKKEFLMEKYFRNLNRLTGSNISFALQLWLKSATKSDKSSIHLLSLDLIDFGFLKNLPIEEVFVLHALLIHERLDVFQLSQVLNISRRQAFLVLMRLADRGIIVESTGFYSVHPLLYRKIVELLQEKNVLH